MLVGQEFDIGSIGDGVGAAILDLLPEITARAEEIEATRHLPADIAERLAKAGAYNLSKPKEYRGLELPPLDFLKVIATISKADASAGWCTMIAVTSSLAAAYLKPEASRTIFGAYDVITGGVFAPMGKADDRGDHYLLSGRWQWGSGSVNCSWMGGGAMIFKDGELQKFENGAPYHRMLYFPVEDVEFIDSWHVSGLKGTGSGDFSVKDLIVPKERSVSFVGDPPQEAGALYKFPLFGLLALGVASVALGNARGALDEIIELVTAKKTTGGGRRQSQRATVQVDIARSVAALCGATTYLERAISRCWQEARSDSEITIESRAELRLACAQVTEVSAEVCKTCYTVGGGSAVYTANSLQRRFRDAHVATQHIATAPATFELAGRVLMGESVDTAML